MQKHLSIITFLLSSSVLAFKSAPFFSPSRFEYLKLQAHAKLEKKNVNVATVLVAAAFGLNILSADMASAKMSDSPSIVISEQIKTFDMSLPSYNKIVDAKASLAAVEDKEAKAAKTTGNSETKVSSSQGETSGAGGILQSASSNPFKPKTKSKAERLAEKEKKRAALEEEAAKREAVLKQKIEF